MKTDLTVIGGGPAGLAAAATAARHGLCVVVVDNGVRPGGRLLAQVHEHPAGDGKAGVWNGQAVAAALAEEALGAGVHLIPQTEVWGILPSWHVLLNGPGPEEVESPLLLVATGAVQRPVALPGWTLPGVIMTGAAQAMLNYHRILPGRRVLMVGVDPLSLSVAQQLVAAGADVVGVVLPPPGPLAGDRANPAVALEELRRLSAWGKPAAAEWGFPVMARQALLEIRGGEAVRSVVLADLAGDGSVDHRTAHEVEVDVVCTSAGLAPLTDLASLAGCQLVHLSQLGGFVPLHGPDLQTTVAGFYVAGSATGVEAAPVAIAQGRLAGHTMARAAGLLNGREAATICEEARQQVAVARQHALALYPGAEADRSSLARMWEEWASAVRTA